MVREVVIMQTGTANTASVMAGLTRVGARPRLATGPAEIASADRVVLPGVGAMAAAMRRLEDDGLVETLKGRIADGRPTLAICLGLQLLCATSAESPGVPGLDLIEANVARFPDSVTVPQMGWNRVTPDPGCRYVQRGFAYFANSFRITDAPDSWCAARADHGGLFVAAVERGDVVACQFHPELSGTWGHNLLARWVEGGPSC
jgi:imidazole glycerol phosphate synthase glutamine amidotransferase subunit